MTYDEALQRLDERGIQGEDARTALDHALRDFTSVDHLVGFVEAERFSRTGVMRWFGQDGGRAVLALMEKVA